MKNEVRILPGNHAGGINWPWLLFWALSWATWISAYLLIFG